MNETVEPAGSNPLNPLFRLFAEFFGHDYDAPRVLAGQAGLNLGDLVQSPRNRDFLWNVLVLAHENGRVPELVEQAKERKRERAADLETALDSFKEAMGRLAYRPHFKPRTFPPVGLGHGEFLWAGVPRPSDYFVGREAMVREIVDDLLGHATANVGVDGQSGVGKSTLAAAVARHPRILEHFVDGVLWAGLGPNADRHEIHARWARAIWEAHDEAWSFERRAQEIAAALAKRRVLIILDDVRDASDAEALRIDAPGCAHLFTMHSKSLNRALAPKAARHLDPFDVSHAKGVESAYELLQVMAPEACQSDEATARELARATFGLPLTLSALGAYLGGVVSELPAKSKAKEVARLLTAGERVRRAARRLGDERGLEIRDVLELNLEDFDRKTRAAYYALGAFASQPARFDFDAAVSVSLTDELTIARFADRNLLVRAHADELAPLSVHQSFHDLCAGRVKADAVERHQAFYLERGQREPDDWQWIEANFAQVERAWDGLPEDAEKLDDYFAVYQDFHRRRGRHEMMIRWSDRILGLSPSGATAAHVLGEKAYSLAALGENQEALEYYEQALPLIRAMGDRRHEATTLNNIGAAYSALGEKGTALEYFEQALPLRRAVGDRRGEATTLNNIGGVYSDLGEKGTALEYYEQALPLIRAMGDRSREATTLNSIGAAYSALGEKGKALEYVEQALPLRRVVGDRGGEATTLNSIGSIYSDLGEKDKALEYFEQALPLRRAVGDRGGEAATLHNIGGVYSDLGQKDKALEYLDQALSLRRAVGDRGGEATTLNYTGGVWLDLGEKGKALEYYERALPLFRAVGDRRGEATTLHNFGMIHYRAGQHENAVVAFSESMRIFAGLALWRDVLDELGMLFASSVMSGDQAAAESYQRKAMDLAREQGLELPEVFAD